MREHVERGRAVTPCGSLGGRATGCNPESSLASANSRSDSARATLMSFEEKAPKEYFRERVPMFDGEGAKLARHVGETAPHAARHERRIAFARGAATWTGEPSTRSSNAARIVVASVDRARRMRPYV